MSPQLAQVTDENMVEIGFLNYEEMLVLKVTNGTPQCETNWGTGRRIVERSMILGPCISATPPRKTICTSLSRILDKGPEASGHRRPYSPCSAHFLAPTGSFAPTKKKHRLTSRGFSRFAARAGPLEPDFGSPGRSCARFLEPKRVDFQTFSPRARVRV